MPLRLSLYTTPTVEPISLADAKLHLRVDGTAEDTLLAAIIKAARVVAETETWKALAPAAYDLYLDEWPAGNEISLPWPPLTAVSFVKYTTNDDVEHTLATTEYGVDTASTPGRIVLNYEKLWPTDTLAPKNPIHIRFSCGYEAANVPATTIAGMKLVITDLYENRGDTVIGNYGSVQPALLPRAATHLFAMDTAKEF